MYVQSYKFAIAVTAIAAAATSAAIKRSDAALEAGQYAPDGQRLIGASSHPQKPCHIHTLMHPSTGKYGQVFLSSFSAEISRLVAALERTNPATSVHHSKRKQQHLVPVISMYVYVHACMHG